MMARRSSTPLLINEYLDEKYDQHTRLRPTNPLDKARMRVWTKLASDHGLAGVVPRVWPSFKAYTDKLDPNELKEGRSAAFRSRSARSAGPRSRAAASASRTSTPAARRPRSSSRGWKPGSAKVRG